MSAWRNWVSERSLAHNYHGPVELILLLQRIAQVIVCRGMVRPQSDRLLELCHRLFELALLLNALPRLL